MRGHHFRALLRSPWTIATLVLLPLAAALVAPVLAAAWEIDRTLVLVAASTLAVAVVVASVFRMADRRAAREFFSGLAPTLGLTYVGGSEVLPLTPLLGGGDRRRYENAMDGPLDPAAGGPACRLAQYTFEVKHESRDSGGHRRTRWEPFHFTVCVTGVPAALARFQGIFVRPRRGLFTGGDWLAWKGHEKMELESQAFNEAFDMRVARTQDRGALRELFAPSFVVWLSEHPLKPGLELAAGSLTVFVDDHAEEEWKLTYLRDAARAIAGRVEKELAEEAGGRPGIT
jgi:hypothetical protein